MRLLLIEDDPTISDLIRRGLEEAGFQVNSCNDGNQGLKQALTTTYSAAIIDIMLPGRDGLSIIEEMRMAGQNTPVLILSAKQSVDDRIQGLQRGGDDYMIKPFSFGELLVRIQALIRRDQKHSAPTKLNLGPLQMDLLHQRVHRDGKEIELPAKEYALLHYMAENADIALSKTSILEKVYGYNFDPQTNVVDVLVCRLRAKIDKEFDQQLIHTIRGIGYVLRSH